MKGLIQANIHYLKQAAKLVDMLEDGSYVRCEPMFYNSTIGGHLRHCLEHYESFIEGITHGRIDYDARHRDELVENKTKAARERIDTIVSELVALEMQMDEGSVSAHDRELRVKMDCGSHQECGDATGGSSLWQVSSIGRELQFLVSHTVHHFAMIRGISQGVGEEMDKNFGMAPSTLRYQEQLIQSSASCEG